MGGQEFAVAKGQKVASREMRNSRRGRGAVRLGLQLRKAVLGQADFTLQALYLVLQPLHQHSTVAACLVLFRARPSQHSQSCTLHQP